MRRFAVLTILGSVVVVVVVVYLFQTQTARPIPQMSDNDSPPVSVARGVAGFSSSEGFQRVTTPRPLNFPRDHGPHPGYHSEWWYYTGNLRSTDGRMFGYELTFFRQSIVPHPTPRASTWATNDVYLAHFTVTDAAASSFLAANRFQRSSVLGLAGAQADPYRVFVEQWSAAGTGATVRVRAAEGAVAVDLNLHADRPAVLHGDQGFVQKGDAVGNATHYYSFTRMETGGTITIAGVPFSVEGVSWFDHEWGTSALSKDQIGWDWFGLHLGDDIDLMYYRFRKKDGVVDMAYSRGTLVSSEQRENVSSNDIQVDVLDTWLSPHTQARYPARWHLQVPKKSIDITIDSLIPDQELRTDFRYWEGSVYLTGTYQGKAIDGMGYIELTGYADSADSVSNK